MSQKAARSGGTRRRGAVSRDFAPFAVVIGEFALMSGAKPFLALAGPPVFWPGP